MITEASYFSLQAGRVKRTVQIRPDLLVDVDSHSRLVGIERIGGTIGAVELGVVLRHVVMPEGQT